MRSTRLPPIHVRQTARPASNEWPRGQDGKAWLCNSRIEGSSPSGAFRGVLPFATLLSGLSLPGGCSYAL